jgi:2-oxo-4-hydroxy-4-carboxy--5-ureidoimidazoline (OHCU) decarboxylase
VRDLQFFLQDFRVASVLSSKKQRCLQLMQAHPECADLLQEAITLTEQTLDDMEGVV